MWIVAHTKPKAEHVAVMNLQQQGYETYLPLSVSPGQIEPQPFFPRYVFVDLEPREGLWRPIISTRGVLSILKTGDAPSVVPARVIDLLRRREEAGVIRLRRRQAAQSFKQGQVVRIHEGLFTGFEGVFQRMNGEERCWVLVEFLGSLREVDAPTEAVAGTAA